MALSHDGRLLITADEGAHSDATACSRLRRPRHARRAPGAPARPLASLPPLTPAARRADGHALLVNFPRRVVLYHFNFKQRVVALSFSPDDKYFAVSHGRRVQVWRAPGLRREFSPLVLHRVYTGMQGDVTALSWSDDGRFFIAGSEDMSCRVFSLHPTEGFLPHTLAGHRDAIVGCWLVDGGRGAVTVAGDGAVYRWAWTEHASRSSKRRWASRLRNQQLRRQGRSRRDGKPRRGDGEGAGAGAAAGGAPGDEDEVDYEQELEEEGARAEAGGEEAAEEEEEEAEAESEGEGEGEEEKEGEGGEEAGAAAEEEEQEKGEGTGRTGASTAHAEGAFAMSVLRGRWNLAEKRVLSQDRATVASAALHAPSQSLVLGFSSGVFALYRLPSFEMVHSLSVSQRKLTAAAVNPAGQWLALASAALGQLVVWEWASDTYVFKQQGHYHDVNTVDYSPDGQYIATGAAAGRALAVGRRVRAVRAGEWSCSARHGAGVQRVGREMSGVPGASLCRIGPASVLCPRRFAVSRRVGPAGASYPLLGPHPSSPTSRPHPHLHSANQARTTPR